MARLARRATWFGVGGPADVSSARLTLTILAPFLPPARLIFGSACWRGSNLLVRDGGIAGVVIAWRACEVDQP